ncbi:hypothetical protein LAZ67_15002326 [Cordylochernes scorpioides]|uniref:Sodefrin-like factor n=1 Tax=Cordylochernes scorpioides TaxID=51811 RepID=A0ABY6L9I2_9ARAC|nr:hypothetical protein LAZ67_15002326 [Cordylochernes scorpioides]
MCSSTAVSCYQCNSKLTYKCEPIQGLQPENCPDGTVGCRKVFQEVYVQVMDISCYQCNSKLTYKCEPIQGLQPENCPDGTVGCRKVFQEVYVQVMDISCYQCNSKLTYKCEPIQGLQPENCPDGTVGCRKVFQEVYVQVMDMIVAVYACGVDVEKGPIRQQLWNAPPCDNVESWRAGDALGGHRERVVFWTDCVATASRGMTQTSPHGWPSTPYPILTILPRGVLPEPPVGPATGR